MMLTSSPKHKKSEVKMRTETAVKFFGSKRKLAEFLNIWPENVSRWGEYVPPARAYELEVRTGGKLKAAGVQKDA
jgi:transcriptional repressor of cell division inhibition gene dicB